jgi:minor extracellular serine protease Vpr
VALLIQRHPTWSPQQVKSALMSSAGAAWGNTERTKEAAVTLEGAGLINIPRADDPQIFTNPASLSYGSLDVTAGAVTRTIIVHITDAGGGSGNWSATIQSQTATPGASISAPATVALAPGGSVDLPVTAQVAADAVPGDDMGFVVLTKGTVTRRVPFYFEATKPAFANMQAADLKAVQTNNTVSGQNRVSQYRFPSWPFGPPASYSGPGVNENGAERLYSIQVPPSAINFGV